jgi:hypothetical protein
VAETTKALTFSEVEIQSLFGHEAAEDENPDRLRQYYLKSSTYDDVAVDLPLRILVGHKGVGKSALFSIAMGEDEERDRLALIVRPDDITGIGEGVTDFLALIRAWRKGLTELLLTRALEGLGHGSGRLAGAGTIAGTIVDVVRQSLSEIKGVSLSPAKQKLIDRFLQTSEITVYIDDLDRGWEGKREDVRRISALLNAVRDLANDNRSMRFRVSLRSDVYFLVRTSDESTDKIEGPVVWHTWTNHEIFALLVKRIETFFDRDITYEQLAGLPQRRLAEYLRPVFEDRFMGLGHWQDAPIYQVLMSLVRKRPRDLVKLCTLAARHARVSRAKRIGTGSLEAIFEEYSQGRIQDTINEFRSELPDIERLLFGMKPSKRERTAHEGYVYRTADLLQKIAEIQQRGSFKFRDGRTATARDLAAFMYKINFLTARKERNDLIVRRYFEEQRYLQSEFADFGFDWEIHPAYRWALQPESLEYIYKSLRLSAEES